MTVQIYFSDYFDIDPGLIEEHGTVDISLINDIPLFIDPFLLFNSADPVLSKLHDDIIKYVTFLRDKAIGGDIKRGLLEEWFCFPEVKQLWLGFSQEGNEGRGLGMDFARKLHRNLQTVFRDFGAEEIAHGSHLEKLCLIEGGVGRDNISDFSANLIMEFLLTYSAKFAERHVDPAHIRSYAIRKARFNYDTETWQSLTFDLPSFGGDYVLLAPRSILTKDETWINRSDLLGQLPEVAVASGDDILRAKVNNYLLKRLPPFEKHSVSERREVAADAVHEFPELIEYFIKMKEEHGDEAVALSKARLAVAETRFIENIRALVELLNRVTPFYSSGGNTKQEARVRVEFLKDVIENKGGWKLFYVKGEPVTTEEHLHIVFRLTWLGTPSDVSREVNDGAGPADFKVSRGAFDKTIVEFKLARNTKLKQNLKNQVSLYQNASDAEGGMKVILFFTDSELARCFRILDELKLRDHPDVILIDGRPRASASKVA